MDAPNPPPSAPLTAPKLPVSLDPQFFPHICDLIMRHLDIDDLLSLREVNRFFHAKSEVKLAKHIVIAPHNLTQPWLPTSPLCVFPKSGFWDSTLTNEIKTVDIIGDHGNDPPYPTPLLKLSVDVVRTQGGQFPYISMPTTREWIGWLDNGAAIKVPNVVKDQVTIVLKDRAMAPCEILLPSVPLNLVIIADGDWWRFYHDEPTSNKSSSWNDSNSSSSCDCEGRDPCSPCACRCDYCLGCLESVVDYVEELAAMVVRYILNVQDSTDKTVTMVDVERCLSNYTAYHSNRPKVLERGAFLSILQCTLGWSTKSSSNLDKHLKFMTRDEYRKEVGDEKFNFQTQVAY